MNKQLYLNINYHPSSHSFHYHVDNLLWTDVYDPYHFPYIETSDKYKLKIWLDLNGLKIHKRIIFTDRLNNLRSYSLIKK